MLTSITCLVAWLAGFLSAIAAIVFQFQMVARRKPGVPLFYGGLGGNPFNIIAHPYLLTEEGLKARKRLFQSLLIFLLSCVVFLAVGIPSGVLH